MINLHDDRVKLYNGDCLEIMDSLIEQGVKVDCIITDPPYKIIQGGCTNKAVSLKGSSHDELKNGNLFKNNDLIFEK